MGTAHDSSDGKGQTPALAVATERDSWLSRILGGRQAQVPKSDPEEKFRKRLQWLKWLAGTVVVIFLAGFAVSSYLGSLARSEDVEAAITTFSSSHEKQHDTLDKKINKLDRRTIRIYSAQRASTARQKLIDTRVELMLERVESPRTRRERIDQEENERKLLREIRMQENQLERIEEDPLNGL